jgi:putative phosphoribosyl transferase
MLAARLAHYAGRGDVVVLALPRGGVPVAFELARELRAPLDVVSVRKLRAPSHKELALGAVAGGDVLVVNDAVVAGLGLSVRDIARLARTERSELVRRELAYRGGRPPVDIAGRTVILVDDGLATGASMKAAATAARERRPARIMVAVPVAVSETCEDLRREVDEVVCMLMPEPFFSVGSWYENFEQTTDAEVRKLLDLSVEEGERGTCGA